MEISIKWSDRLKCPHAKFQEFVQKMANRILQGSVRYGLPNKSAKYWTRACFEMTAYGKTGNAEHLFNIANYCQLEYEAPQHPKFHIDTSIGSATRNTRALERGSE